MATETQKTESALDTQKGGDHYKNRAIQPIEFGMRNHWDPCAFAIVKHVTRHKDKGGKLDIEKAIHYGQLREELVKYHNLPKVPRKHHVSMGEYVERNEITGKDAIVLESLYEWVNYPEKRHAYTTMQQALQAILEDYD